MLDDSILLCNFAINDVLSRIQSVSFVNHVLLKKRHIILAHRRVTGWFLPMGECLVSMEK